MEGEERLARKADDRSSGGDCIPGPVMSRSRFDRDCTQLHVGRSPARISCYMATPTSPLTQCPDVLVPLMANILASRPIIDRLPSDTQAQRPQASPSTVHCLHQQSVALTRAEYDELMMLFNRTMGQAFTVPLEPSQKICTVTFAAPPRLAKPLVYISLRKLASTRIKLGHQVR